MFYVDSCEKFNKYKEEIVEGTYIIRYLDNNEFSNMELVESKKLKDVKELSSLCKQIFARCFSRFLYISNNNLHNIYTFY